MLTRYPVSMEGFESSRKRRRRWTAVDGGGDDGAAVDADEAEESTGDLPGWGGSGGTGVTCSDNAQLLSGYSGNWLAATGQSNSRRPK